MTPPPGWQFLSEPHRDKELNAAVPGTGSALRRGLRDWEAGLEARGTAGEGLASLGEREAKGSYEAGSAGVVEVAVESAESEPKPHPPLCGQKGGKDVAATASLAPDPKGGHFLSSGLPS